MLSNNLNKLFYLLKCSLRQIKYLKNNFIICNIYFFNLERKKDYIFSMQILLSFILTLFYLLPGKIFKSLDFLKEFTVFSLK